MPHLLTLMALLASMAQAPALDDETARYIASMKARLEDRAIDVDSRDEDTPGLVEMTIDGPQLFMRASL